MEYLFPLYNVNEKKYLNLYGQLNFFFSLEAALGEFELLEHSKEDAIFESIFNLNR